MKFQHIVLRDTDAARLEMLPLAYTRPISELRLGVLTLRDKWRIRMGTTVRDYSWETAGYLQEKFPRAATPAGEPTLTVDSDIVATDALAAELAELKVPNADLYTADGAPVGTVVTDPAARRVPYTLTAAVNRLAHVYDIFLGNGEALETDIPLLRGRRRGQRPDKSCTVIGDASRLFIEEGAQVTGAFINVTDGPVYIGREAVVMEGACLRGPIAVCSHSQVKMGAKVYGATTLGPHCKVGGELSNVVIIGYSNKAHDGFLGNAVVGEWCNLGAGCTASNLKNDYTEIKLWNYPAQRFLRTGLQFCGLIMGDHSKAGINTMFNTATTLGVGVNIHGSGFPRNFVASFTEGSAAGYSEVSVSKFCDIARRVMARRGIELTQADERMFEAIHEISDGYRFR